MPVDSQTGRIYTRKGKQREFDDYDDMIEQNEAENTTFCTNLYK